MNALKKLALCLVMAATLFWTPTTAQATFQMQLISSTAGTLTITDNGANDSSPIAGVILFSGTWGAYNIQVDTGESKPVLGSAASPDVDLSYSVNRTTAGAAETLTIKVSDMGFTTSPEPLNLMYGGTNGPGTTSSLLAGTGLNNVNFNTGDASGTVGPEPTGAYSGNGGFTVPNNGGQPYSLTLAITLNNNGTAGISSGDGELSAAPAPAGLVLALTGMPVLGLGAWLRRRRVLTAA
jgi:hypothetical protein